MIQHEAGASSPIVSKYNEKYVLSNLLVCGDCGASYRRRTERGKVSWSCTTRIEKGEEACAVSPTINEEWIKEQLTELICCGVYDESVV